MNVTKIQWTDMTVNPLRASLVDADGNVVATGHHCEKVSPGCKNCYASRLQTRFQMPPFDKRKGIDHLEIRHRLDEKILQSVLRRRKPTRIFWCDMTDMFGDWVTDDQLDQVFAVMALTPQHTHQVLTKRPERALKWHRAVGGVMRRDFVVSRAARLLESIGRGGSVKQFPEWPLLNVHLGVSVESPDYLWRVDELRKIPTAVPCVSRLFGAVESETARGQRVRRGDERRATADRAVYVAL